MEALSEVHAESSCIMKSLLKQARENNMNVVIDGTMSSVKSYQKSLNDFKGYNAEVYYMFVPPKISVQRAMQRFSNGKKYNGRYIPAKVLMSMDKNEATFDYVKTKVGKWGFYSNYSVGANEKKNNLNFKG